MGSIAAHSSNSRARRWPGVTYGHATWRRHAACRYSDADQFFPVGATGTAANEIERAKAICASCPVQAACLQFAFATNQEFGVWGGHDEDERRALRRQWRAAEAGGDGTP